MSLQEPCPKVEALSALTDGALPAQERAAVETHAAGCALCAPMLAQMQRLHSDFAALPDPASDFDVAADVDRRIGQLGAPQPARKPRAVRGRWWQAALLAPGAVAAVGVGLWLGASLVPATVAMPAAQMAAFSAMPPGALCPVSTACGRTAR